MEVPAFSQCLRHAQVSKETITRKTSHIENKEKTLVELNIFYGTPLVH